MPSLVKIVTEWLKQFLFFKSFLSEKMALRPGDRTSCHWGGGKQVWKQTWKDPHRPEFTGSSFERVAIIILFIVFCTKEGFLTQRLQEYCRHDTTVSRIRSAQKLLKLNFWFKLHRIGEAQKLKWFTWNRTKISLQPKLHKSVQFHFKINLKCN